MDQDQINDKTGRCNVHISNLKYRWSIISLSASESSLSLRLAAVYDTVRVKQIHYTNFLME